MIGALVLLAGAALAFAENLEFVRIPAGSFVMGCAPVQACAKTLPRKVVTIEKPFQLSKYEVTVGQFRFFVKATGYRTDAEKAGDTHTWRSPGFPLSNRQPVVFMSLNDAAAYCAFIGGASPRRGRVGVRRTRRRHHSSLLGRRDRRRVSLVFQ